jgi:hypothetical protein
MLRARQADTVAYRALWVDVDEQRLATAAREGAREVDGRCRLADTSLLAYHSENSTH